MLDLIDLPVAFWFGSVELGSPATPWPATLPEQVRAVAEALARSPAPLTLPALEAQFKGRGQWKRALPTLLQTLEALGRAQVVDVGQAQDAVFWRA